MRMTKAGAAMKVEELAASAAEQVGAASPGTSADTAQPAPPAKTVAQVLGEITWLMTPSPRHKAIPLGDLEWLVMPAILLQQFRIFYKGEQPVGVVFWTQADEIVAKRIDAGDARLTPAEWKSGANKRIIDVIAPFGGEAEMREQLVASMALGA
jgi:cytolysin-activating lysine-acyltransferase